MSNFHQIKTIISNSRTFRETFMGVAEYSLLRLKENVIGFTNKAKMLVFRIIKPKETNIIFDSSFSSKIREEIKNINNSFVLKNNDTIFVVGIKKKCENNDFSIRNSKIKVSASYLTRLNMMDGTLNDYQNITLNETGQKTV